MLATTLSIVAVFLPIGFMGGIIGKFFHEFGVTIVAAVLISMFVSFTLEQRVLRAAELLVHASVNLACVAADELKPMRVPPHVRAALESSMAKQAAEQEDA